jgi:NADPH:quinone reductase-like Zn-dependent oxidoreductase
MKAIYYNTFGGPDVLQYGELPDPVAGPGQLLIHVKAVSLNPADSKIRSGNLKTTRGPRFPKIPGSDFAGIVKESLDFDTGFKPCDKVYGFVPVISGEQGAMAEFVLASPKLVMNLPEGMAFEEAASLPGASLTALNGLRRLEDLLGKSVLINGATGGVGHYAVQLARARGAKVTAICGSGNSDLALKLGASEVIEYNKTDLSKIDKKFDMIFDAHGRMNKADICRLLNRKGVYASTQFSRADYFSSLLIQLVFGKKLTSASMRAHTNDFEEIESYFKKGVLNPYVEHTFDLSHAVEAFRLAESGKSRGKIVIRI